jgi:hypothetical protein
MNCCDQYGACNQGRDCPVRAKPANNTVATLRPLYRRCDVMGVCQSPDAECKANCRLHDAVAETGPEMAPVKEVDLTLDFVAWTLVVTAVMATLAFCFGLYADQLASGLQWLADGAARLVQRFAAWPLGWN